MNKRNSDIAARRSGRQVKEPRRFMTEVLLRNGEVEQTLDDQCGLDQPNEGRRELSDMDKLGDQVWKVHLKHRGWTWKPNPGHEEHSFFYYTKGIGFKDTVEGITKFSGTKAIGEQYEKDNRDISKILNRAREALDAHHAATGTRTQNTNTRPTAALAVSLSPLTVGSSLAVATAQASSTGNRAQNANTVFTAARAASLSHAETGSGRAVASAQPSSTEDRVEGTNTGDTAARTASSNHADTDSGPAEDRVEGTITGATVARTASSSHADTDSGPALTTAHASSTEDRVEGTNTGATAAHAASSSHANTGSGPAVATAQNSEGNLTNGITETQAARGVASYQGIEYYRTRSIEEINAKIEEGRGKALKELEQLLVWKRFQMSTDENREGTYIEYYRTKSFKEIIAKIEELRKEQEEHEKALKELEEILVWERSSSQKSTNN